MNPWTAVKLSDYEEHMKLDTVMQLQTLNTMMKTQLSNCSAASVMVLGAAGGNGFEHISDKFQKVYAVDINEVYLAAVRERYSALGGALECICLDLNTEHDRLPSAELLIADLLVEYIGYENFCKVIRQVKPCFISCGIQINTDDSFISDSPYIHAFDDIASVHHQIDERTLADTVIECGYKHISTSQHMLPNGKKLVQLDFSTT